MHVAREILVDAATPLREASPVLKEPTNGRSYNLETAPARPKSQEKSSPPTNRISLSDAAKISSHNEGKLRRLVKRGQLRATIIIPAPRPKHAPGREVQIWVDPADVLALEPSATPRKQEVPPRKKKATSIAANASKQKAAGDAATRN